MANKFNRLALILSALTIAGTLSGPANALFRSDLSAVRRLVEARDVEGLLAFIQQNPQVLDDSMLGRELAAFISTPPHENIFTALGFVNPMPASLRGTLEASKHDSSLY